MKQTFKHLAILLLIFLFSFFLSASVKAQDKLVNNQNGTFSRVTPPPLETGITFDKNVPTLSTEELDSILNKNKKIPIYGKALNQSWNSLIKVSSETEILGEIILENKVIKVIPSISSEKNTSYTDNYFYLGLISSLLFSMLMLFFNKKNSRIFEINFIFLIPFIFAYSVSTAYSIIPGAYMATIVGGMALICVSIPCAFNDYSESTKLTRVLIFFAIAFWLVSGVLMYFFF
jgi:hypothetical protein